MKGIKTQMLYQTVHFCAGKHWVGAGGREMHIDEGKWLGEEALYIKQMVYGCCIPDQCLIYTLWGGFCNLTQHLECLYCDTITSLFDSVWDHGDTFLGICIIIESWHIYNNSWNVIIFGIYHRVRSPTPCTLQEIHNPLCRTPAVTPCSTSKKIEAIYNYNLFLQERLPTKVLMGFRKNVFC